MWKELGMPSKKIAEKGTLQEETLSNCGETNRYGLTDYLLKVAIVNENLLPCKGCWTPSFYPSPFK